MRKGAVDAKAARLLLIDKTSVAIAKKESGVCRWQAHMLQTSRREATVRLGIYLLQTLGTSTVTRTRGNQQEVAYRGKNKQGPVPRFSYHQNKGIDFFTLNETRRSCSHSTCTAFSP
jgi:hypothetical protein